MKLREKEELYLKYKYHYYILGEPIVEDYEFDLLEEDLRSLGSKVVEIVDFPTIKELEKMGYDPKNIVDSQEKDETKYPHHNPYLSLERRIIFISPTDNPIYRASSVIWITCILVNFFCEFSKTCKPRKSVKIIVNTNLGRFTKHR